MKSLAKKHFAELSVVASGAAVFLVPVAAYAAPQSFRELANLVIDIINNAIIPLIFALALITFLWGVARYFIFSTEEAKTKGRDIMVWGLLGMVVMVGVWGLVNIVINTFFLEVKCLNDPGVFGCLFP